MLPAPDVWIGCAGWAIPRAHSGLFPATGSGLARYAARLTCAEVNSSFYRPHRPATYARWAAAVPARFRFAVKMPRAITHGARLAGTPGLAELIAGVRALGEKLGPLLVQLPPSLDFDGPVAAAFFSMLRGGFGGGLACEPRHPSWFSAEAEELLVRFRVARVAADPAPVPAGAEPGGWSGLVYLRLHGSPRRYYSAYPVQFLEKLAEKLVVAASAAPVWCILDNTAGGAALLNALWLQARLGAEAGPPNLPLAGEVT